MTEDEAKTKKCFAPRAAGLGEDINCIASACMAWRVRPEVTETRDLPYGEYPRGESGWVGLGTSYDWSGLRYVRRTPESGFCGLAGADAGAAP